MKSYKPESKKVLESDRNMITQNMSSLQFELQLSVRSNGVGVIQLLGN